MRILPFLTLLGAGTFLSDAATSRAVTYTETDTTFGSHQSTGISGQANPAEVVPYDMALPAFALTAIQGTISYNTTATGLTEGDVYQIFISDPAAFSAATPVGAPNENGFDTQLFLFNASGQGVESNDNDPNSGNGTGGASKLSALPAANAAGVYYLVITGASQSPAVGTNGTAIFPDTDPTVTYAAATTAPFTGYTGSSTEGGEYNIVLTGVLTSVPEPSDAVWIVAGAAAGGLVLKRRKASRARA